MTVADVAHAKTKEHKSSKNKSKNSSDAVLDDSASGQVEDQSQNVQVKEKKKKKRKHQESEGPRSSVDAIQVVDGAQPEEQDRIMEGAAQSVSEKKSRKKGKKEKERDREETEEANGTEPPKKKKKQKHIIDDDTPAVSPDASQHQEVTSATSLGESQFKKERKKDRKDKKEREHKRSETDTTTIVEPTAASAPTSTQETSSQDASAYLKEHSISIDFPGSSSGAVFRPYTSFSQLQVPDELRSAFNDFKEPTPIQACTWPLGLDGRDIVGIAETGSGKTLGFGIPALTRLLSSPSRIEKPKKKKHSSTSTVSVLILAPTRELAVQTHDTLSALGAAHGIASVALFGGVPKDPQIKMLKNIDHVKDGKVTRIIVGTPGRILDLLQEGHCDLSGVDYLVLDEADRMLDKGFENDIRNIISHTKPIEERQTMMFSATWPEAVRRLAATFQRDPVRVTVGSDELTANSRVEQAVQVLDDARQKDDCLLGHLRSLSHQEKSRNKSSSNAASDKDQSRVLVFALYKKEADRVEFMLRRKGYSVGALHGDRSQAARMEALEKFKDGTTPLLVATDVAARGLDIPNVGAVINYTFPLTIEDYIHRIGRTGRGGRSGKSITFFTGDAHEKALAGELARVLRDSGFECKELQERFPMTIKKKTHSVYGAFFRDDIPAPKGPTKITFD